MKTAYSHNLFEHFVLVTSTIFQLEKKLVENLDKVGNEFFNSWEVGWGWGGGGLGVCMFCERSGSWSH